MDVQDLIDQLDELSLSLSELARLTGESEARVTQFVTGAEPVPHWLDLVMLYWSTFPNALELARGAVDAGRVGVN